MKTLIFLVFALTFAVALCHCAGDVSRPAGSTSTAETLTYCRDATTGDTKMGACGALGAQCLVSVSGPPAADGVGIVQEWGVCSETACSETHYVPNAIVSNGVGGATWCLSEGAWTAFPAP